METPAAGEQESGSCACHADEERAAHDPAYRRALWIVVVLNLGFGAVEIVGGFLSRSQALKADALDFLGDGSITLVGLLALAWAAHTRARVVLVQGWFLAALRFGVIGMAIWRAMNAVPPEADLIGRPWSGWARGQCQRRALAHALPRQRRRQRPRHLAFLPQ